MALVLREGEHPRAAHGIGVRVRLKGIKGLTAKNVLREPLYFPALLGENLEWDEVFSHEDFMTIGAGEFSQPAGGENTRNLRTINTELLTLNWSPRWLTYHYRDPEIVKDALIDIGRSRSPFHFQAKLPNARAEIRMKATLRRMTPRLRRGETDTRYYALEIKEYREMAVRRAGKGGGAPGGVAGPGGGGGRGGVPTKHKLDGNDTLRHLARRYYGSEKGWRFLARRNGLEDWGGNDAIVSHKKFKRGDMFKIPEPPERLTGGIKPSRLSSEESDRAGLRIGEDV